MISKQPRNDSGIDASASIGSAWFRRGTLDVNQVIGDTTAVRLNVMGENARCRTRQSQNERYGVAPSVAFGLGTANRLYLNYLHVTQHNTPDGGIPTIGLPGYSAPSAGTAALNHSGKVDTHNFTARIPITTIRPPTPLPCVLSTTSTITPPFATLRVGRA